MNWAFEGLKIFLAAPKNGVFFTAGSWEKDTIFGAARKFFGPSYFVTAWTQFQRVDTYFFGAYHMLHI